MFVEILGENGNSCIATALLCHSSGTRRFFNIAGYKHYVPIGTEEKENNIRKNNFFLMRNLGLIKTKTIATFSAQQTPHKYSQAGSPRSVQKKIKII
jgi:hypothetical protein